jgi:hypothetical protein
MCGARRGRCVLSLAISITMYESMGGGRTEREVVARHTALVLELDAAIPRLQSAEPAVGLGLAPASISSIGGGLALPASHARRVRPVCPIDGRGRGYGSLSLDRVVFTPRAVPAPQHGRVLVGTALRLDRDRARHGGSFSTRSPPAAVVVVAVLVVTLVVVASGAVRLAREVRERHALFRRYPRRANSATTADVVVRACDPPRADPSAEASALR